MSDDKQVARLFSADWKKNSYEVIFTYSAKDTLPDVSSMFTDDDASAIEMIEVEATSMQAAIADAYAIVLANRCDEVTNYIIDNPLYKDEDKETWTREELENLHKMGVVGNVFSDFMTIEPTAIQVCRKENRPIMEDMSMKNMEKALTRLSDDAEEFLKGNDNDG